MGAAYMKALQRLKANGGQIYMQFVTSPHPVSMGSGGALESFMDTVTPLSAAPIKWQSTAEFHRVQSLLGRGCAGTLGTGVSVPMAPSNLRVTTDGQVKTG